MELKSINNRFKEDKFIKNLESFSDIRSYLDDLNSENNDDIDNYINFAVTRGMQKRDPNSLYGCGSSTERRLNNLSFITKINSLKNSKDYSIIKFLNKFNKYRITFEKSLQQVNINISANNKFEV